MSDETEFFLASNKDVVAIETLEISHPAFSQIYRIVKNAPRGITLNNELGQSVTYEYYPAQIVQQGTRENLDFGIKVDLGDLGEIIPAEIDNVKSSNNDDEPPSVVYRLYRSDATNPLDVIPLSLEKITMNRQGSSFNAIQPSLNTLGIGILYTPDAFECLRGLV